MVIRDPETGQFRLDQPLPPWVERPESHVLPRPRPRRRAWPARVPTRSGEALAWMIIAAGTLAWSYFASPLVGLIFALVVVRSFRRGD